MKTALTTWMLLLSLLLQPLAWALPAAHSPQAERLLHQMAHALDHGHHRHGDGDGHVHAVADGHDQVHGSALQTGHTMDPGVIPASDWAPAAGPTSVLGGPSSAAAPGELDFQAQASAHAPHHSHPGEPLQLPGMPVAGPASTPKPAHSAPQVRPTQQPLSADLAGPLRPPQTAA